MNRSTAAQKFLDWRWHCAMMLSLLAILALCLYHLSDGDWNLKKVYYFSNAYQDMWVRLLQGDPSSDRYQVHDEMFLIGNKIYIYFLPFPAFIRGILSIFHLDGYAVISTLLACAIFIGSTLAFYFELLRMQALQHIQTQNIARVVAIGLVVSSPIIMMLSFPITYWEATIWACTAAWLSMYASLRVLSRTPSALNLYAFALACGLTLFTRPTFSVAVSALFFLTIGLLYLRRHQDSMSRGYFSLSKLIFALLIYSTCLVALGILNYTKWGSPFKFGDYQYYTLLWDAEYLALFQRYSYFQFDRIPEGFSYYFLPAKDLFGSHFPFIQMGGHNYFAGFAKHIDYYEATLPISLTLPFYLLAFAIGSGLWIKQVVKNINFSQHTACWSFMPTAIAGLLPMAIMLGWFAFAIRYTGEFIPGILAFSLFAICTSLKYLDQRLMGKPSKIIRKKSLLLIYGLIIAIALSSLYLESSSAWVQRQALLTRDLAYRTPMPPTRLDEKMDFSNKGRAHVYLKPGESQVQNQLNGWSTPESWGTWSEGKSARLEFPLPVFPLDPKEPIELSLETRAFITPNHPSQRVNIWVNGQEQPSQILTAQHPGPIVIRILEPNPVLLKSKVTLYLDLRFPDAISPEKLNAGNDNRTLAIGLISGKFTAINTPKSSTP